MAKMLKFVLISVILLGLARGENYCNDYGQDHTMCKYPGIAIEKCGSPEMTQVTKMEIDTILRVHNEKRAAIAKGQVDSQPSASNMRELTWSDDLAKVAQRWADQCTHEHDCNDCRKTKKFESVGQNILEICDDNKKNSYDSNNWNIVINDWFGQVKHFTAKGIASYQYSNEWGYYTQMVWADTYEVGCGRRQFQKDKWWNTIMVCNYGPTGNIPCKQVYKEGNACSDCPSGTKCSPIHQGLCAKEDMDTVTTLLDCTNWNNQECGVTYIGKEWDVKNDARGDYLKIHLSQNEKTTLILNKKVTPPAQGTVCLQYNVTKTWETPLMIVAVQQEGDDRKWNTIQEEKSTNYYKDGLRIYVSIIELQKTFQIRFKPGVSSEFADTITLRNLEVISGSCKIHGQ